MKIFNATVTSKENFTEKYHCLMKNLYNQNCSSKNEGNINRGSEISKIHSLHGFFLLQPDVNLSPFEQNLQEAPQTLHHSTDKRHFCKYSVRKTAPYRDRSQQRMRTRGAGAGVGGVYSAPLYCNVEN